MDERGLYWALSEKYRSCLKKEKKKAKKSLWVTVPLGIALGVGSILLERRVESLAFPPLAAMILMFFAILLVEVAIHEAGHMVCGLLSGYRFVSYRILVFAVYKKEGRLRFGRYAVPGTLGQCLMVPPSEDAEKVPYRLYHMGGVIFDGISAVISLLLCLVIPVDWLRCYFLFAGLFALLMAFANGVPRETPIPNDGGNLLNMIRNPKAREAACRQLFLVEAMSQGVRYGDMPENLFPEYTQGDASPLMLAQTHMTVQRRMEKGEFAEAKALILRVLTETTDIPVVYFTAYLFDLWYLEMVGEHRREIVELLKNELADFGKRQKNSVQVIRCTLAYQYLYVGDLVEIGKLRARLDRLGKSYVFKGDLAFENQLIDNAGAIYDAWASGHG